MTMTIKFGKHLRATYATLKVTESSVKCTDVRLRISHLIPQDGREMLNIAGEVRTNSWAVFLYELLLMGTQVFADQ